MGWLCQVCSSSLGFLLLGECLKLVLLADVLVQSHFLDLFEVVSWSLLKLLEFLLLGFELGLNPGLFLGLELSKSLFLLLLSLSLFFDSLSLSPFLLEFLPLLESSWLLVDSNSVSVVSKDLLEFLVLES